MNTTLKQMIHRASSRNFVKNKRISQEQLDAIIKATIQSPTYINAQQYSILVINEQKNRDLLIELTRGERGDIQQHISDCGAFLLFLIDFNKVNKTLEFENKSLEITNYFESIMIGAVDAAIACEAATVAAESMGFGTVMIGAVRKDTKKVIEHFNLPPLTFPLLGLCIGEKDREIDPRPRLPKETFVHYESYKEPNWKEILENYNEESEEYMEKTYGTENFRWTRYVSGVYNKSYWEELSKVYNEQKLGIK